MTARAAVTILDAMGDPNLFAPCSATRRRGRGGVLSSPPSSGFPWARTWPNFIAAARGALSRQRRHRLKRPLS